MNLAGRVRDVKGHNESKKEECFAARRVLYGGRKRERDTNYIRTVRIDQRIIFFWMEVSLKGPQPDAHRLWFRGCG